MPDGKDGWKEGREGLKFKNKRHQCLRRWHKKEEEGDQ